MKALKFSLVIALFLCATFQNSHAQELLFDTTTHDFGNIYDDAGLATHTFEFTNTGTKPLILTRVRPGCGCTTTDYSKDSIAPGGRGFITTQFNPRGYSSVFAKSISVSSNDIQQENIVLIIRGVVVNKEQEKSRQYPYSLGALRYDAKSINFAAIDVTTKIQDTIGIYNPQDTAVTIIAENIPEHIRVEFIPSAEIQSKQESKCIVHYDATKTNNFGWVQDQFLLTYKNKGTKRSQQIIVTANISEDFSNYTKRQLKRAPKIFMETTEFSFDTIQQGKEVHSEFTFKNTGKSNLIIRRISTTCGCTAGQLDKKIYAKNETGTIQVTFRTQGKRNLQRQRITLITNDPANPTIQLYIKGFVEVPTE